MKLHEIYENEKQVIIVMEYVEGLRLLDYVRDHAPLSEKKAIQLMKQLLEATIHFHSLGFIHRDIKLENVMVTGEDTSTGDKLVLKMIDFGLAIHVDDGGFCKKCGTPGYIAPEVFTSETYGKRVDVFSLGVILFTM